jgi:hypothetical protein
MYSEPRNGGILWVPWKVIIGEGRSGITFILVYCLECIDKHVAFWELFRHSIFKLLILCVYTISFSIIVEIFRIEPCTLWTLLPPVVLLLILKIGIQIRGRVEKLANSAGSC